MGGDSGVGSLQLFGGGGDLDGFGEGADFEGNVDAGFATSGESDVVAEGGFEAFFSDAKAVRARGKGRDDEVSRGGGVGGGFNVGGGVREEEAGTGDGGTAGIGGDATEDAAVGLGEDEGNGEGS